MGNRTPYGGCCIDLSQLQQGLIGSLCLQTDNSKNDGSTGFDDPFARGIALRWRQLARTARGQMIDLRMNELSQRVGADLFRDDVKLSRLATRTLRLQFKQQKTNALSI